MWKISTMVQQINLVTDESFTIPQIINFINDGIAQLNIYYRAKYPYIVDTDIEYTALPEKWQRQLFVPYAAARIKQNDSSQFEYQDWYAQFQENIVQFGANISVSDEYLDEGDNENPMQSDFSWDGGGW